MQCLAVLDSLPVLIRYIDAQARIVGFSSNDLYMVQLAAEEALVNVMNHAYPQNQPGALVVDCEVVKDHLLRIIVQDQGKAFNPLEFKKFDQQKASLDKRGMGGLGIFYLKEGMDNLSYSRINGWNVLTMEKLYKAR